MDENINALFYKEGYDLAIQNAKSISKIAIIASKENEFGIACALNILSAEEAIKANFLIIKHYNPNSEISDFDEIFLDHKVKHKNIKELAILHKIKIDLIKKDIELFNGFLDIIKDLPDNLRKETENSLASIFEIKKWVEEQDKKEINTNDILKWIKSANKDKNNGLYVGKNKTTWHNPRAFSKRKYDTDIKFGLAIIDYVENIERVSSFVANFITEQNYR